MFFIGLTGNSCKTISLNSVGSSTYDGWYQNNIFGKYELTSVDTEGNNVYQKIVGDNKRFIQKNSDKNWVVSFNVSKR